MADRAAGRHDPTERGRLGIPVSDTPNRLRRSVLRVLPALARLHRIRDEVRRLVTRSRLRSTRCESCG